MDQQHEQEIPLPSLAQQREIYQKSLKDQLALFVSGDVANRDLNSWTVARFKTGVLSMISLLEGLVKIYSTESNNEGKAKDKVKIASLKLILEELNTLDGNEIVPPEIFEQVHPVFD